MVSATGFDVDILNSSDANVEQELHLCGCGLWQGGLTPEALLSQNGPRHGYARLRDREWHGSCGPF